MARNQKIPPIKSEVDRNVYMTLTIDRRGKSDNERMLAVQKFPMVVLVAYKSKKYYYRTGIIVTEAEYDKILKSSIKGKYFDIKKNECVKFDAVVKKVKGWNLILSGRRPNAPPKMRYAYTYPSYRGFVRLLKDMAPSHAKGVLCSLKY